MIPIDDIFGMLPPSRKPQSGPEGAKRKHPERANRLARANRSSWKRLLGPFSGLSARQQEDEDEEHTDMHIRKMTKEHQAANPFQD